LLERRATDPEGAITAARTLLETVCKHILDEKGEPYEDGIPLPKLYNTAVAAHSAFQKKWMILSRDRLILDFIIVNFSSRSRIPKGRSGWWTRWSKRVW